MLNVASHRHFNWPDAGLYRCQWLATKLSEALLMIGFSVLVMLIAARMRHLSVNQPEVAAVMRASDFSEAEWSYFQC